MQTLTVEEIAKRMQKTDNEQALRLPRAFASAVSDILNAEDTTATTNKHPHSRSGR
jgi:hypothetical protein